MNFYSIKSIFLLTGNPFQTDGDLESELTWEDVLSNFISAQLVCVGAIMFAFLLIRCRQRYAGDRLVEQCYLKLIT